MAQLPITIKELLPIVMAGVLWGKQWEGHHVLAHCDNAAVVAIINSGTSRQPLAMQLIRTLCFTSAHFKFTIRTKHLPGTQNVAADALSRGNPQLFLSLTPQAHLTPNPIPRSCGNFWY